MDLLRVFVSSILDVQKEDLTAERAAAIDAAERFSLFAVWAFERAPASSSPLVSSYLDQVRGADIFLLLLGNVLTSPVRAEYDFARALGKPILAFAKRSPSRSPEAVSLLRQLDTKYDEFEEIEALREKVRLALQEEVVRRARAGVRATGGIRPRVEALHRARTDVSCTPIFPQGFAGYPFGIQAVTEDAVVLERAHQSIHLPLGRVTDVLPGGVELPALVLNGRMQWRSPARLWQFFPESPSSGIEQLWGLAKPASPHDPTVQMLCHTLVGYGQAVRFVRVDRVPEVLGAGYQIVYDNNGRYLHWAGRDGGQILVVSGP